MGTIVDLVVVRLLAQTARIQQFITILGNTIVDAFREVKGVHCSMIAASVVTVATYRDLLCFGIIMNAARKTVLKTVATSPGSNPIFRPSPSLSRMLFWPF